MPTKPTKWFTRVKGFLPYRVVGSHSELLRIDTHLSKLSILLGPNASGKTCVLELLGYATSTLLPTEKMALGLLLTATLRPRHYIPDMLSAVLKLSDGEEVRVLYARAGLLYRHVYRSYVALRKIVRELSESLAEIVEEDVKDVGDLAENVERNLRSRGTRTTHTKRILESILDLAEKFLGKPGEAGLASTAKSDRTTQRTYTVLEALYGVGDLRKSRVFLGYAEKNGKVRKIVVVQGSRGLAVLAQPPIDDTLGSVLVLHPGFAYIRGLFERLYEHHVEKGLENEKDALELLKDYIPWVEGYEIINGVLKLKSAEGRRLEIYELSDGQRMAVLLSLLYAFSRPPSLILLDTPEAFIHPDGLSVAASFTVRLVSLGNQVVAATQSIEFLQELLERAQQETLIDEARVSRLELVESEVKPKGSWRGMVSLNAIVELGADLRR